MHQPQLNVSNCEAVNMHEPNWVGAISQCQITLTPIVIIAGAAPGGAKGERTLFWFGKTGEGCGYWEGE